MANSEHRYKYHGFEKDTIYNVYCKNNNVTIQKIKK